MKEYNLSWNGHNLKLGKNTCIMGILNVTPDSFSDGGKFLKTGDAVARAMKMVEEGADIIDIGGESSRPFADPVSVAEEIDRVVPVVEQLSKHIPVPISVDTVKAEVAKRAIEAGAAIINDISAMEQEPEIGDVAAEYGVPIILMHMKGDPGTMQVAPSYDNPVDEIRDYLEKAITRAEERGISRANIILDPGIGFGKTVAHNFLLLKELKAFSNLDLPLLVGTSRKSFVRNTVSGNAPSEEAIETGTQASVSAAVLNGAHIVRVHDVASTVSTIQIIDAVKNA